MTTHSGNEGKVFVSSNEVAEIVDFTVTESAVAIDDSKLTDTYDTNLTGSKSWRGQATCHWDEGDTNGQEALLVGAEVTLNLYPEGNDSGDDKMSGTARVTEVGVAVRRNATVQRTISFVGSGALTHSTV